MVALLVVAVALGLNNFGASIAIGVSGVNRRTELKVAAVFGLCDVVMPAAGMLIGTRPGRAAGVGCPLGGRRDTVRDRGLGSRRGGALPDRPRGDPVRADELCHVDRRAEAGPEAGRRDR